MDQARQDTNTLFSGTYANANTPLWLSAFAGASPGTNLQVSSLLVNQVGYTVLTAAGSSNSLSSASIISQRTAEFTADPFSQIKMTTNKGLGPSALSENISIVNATDTYYDALATGDLYLYGSQAPIGNLQGPLARMTQYLNTNFVDISGAGTHIANLLVSSINGLPPGGGGAVGPNITASTLVINPTGYIETPLLLADSVTIAQDLTVSSINGFQFPQSTLVTPANLLVSTITVNPAGSIRMRASGDINSPVTAGIFFQRTDDVSTVYQPGIKISFNQTDLPYGVSSLENISITKADSVTSAIGYDNLALGNLFIYGNIPVRSTVSQTAVLRPYNSTTDLEIVTTAIHTNSAYISSLYVSSIVDYVISISSVTTEALIASSISTITNSASKSFSDTMSTATGTMATALISTLKFPAIQFNPTSGLLQGVTVDLGMGGFLGSAVGQLGGVAMNAIVGGIVLATGAVVLTNARTANTIIVPGQTNASTFNLVNTQTQLQFSTIGTAQSSFQRFVSSIDPSIVPGRELITSTVIPAGTLCVRSFSDPLNVPNPSSITSTIQSFGYWQPVPAPLAVSSLTVSPGVLTANAGLNALGGINMNTISYTGWGQVISNSNITAANANLSSLNVVNPTGAGVIINTPSFNVVKGMTVSSINGFQFPSPVPQTSTTSTYMTLYTSSLFASTINTLFETVSSLTVSSINNAPYPPPTSVTVSSFSYLSASTLTTSTLTSPSGSIPSLSVSTINGQSYPPPAVGSTIIGNFNVTSTITAYRISTTTEVSGFGIVGQSYVQSLGLLTAASFLSVGTYGIINSFLNVGGALTCSNAIQGNSITSLGAITGGSLGVSGNINAGGMTTTGTIFPNAINSPSFITGSNITDNGVTTLKQLGTSTINANTGNIGGVIFASNNISSQNASINNLIISSINGNPYPPSTSGGVAGSTFSTLYTSTLYASTIIASNASVSTAMDVGGNLRVGGNGSFLTLNNTGLIVTNQLIANSNIQANAIASLGGITASGLITGQTVTATTTVSGFTGSFGSGGLRVAGTSVLSNALTVTGLTTLNGLNAVTGSYTSFVNVGSYIAAASAQIGGDITAASATIVGGVTAQTGNISSFITSSINGVTYPPPASAISTFNQLFTSSLLASSITVKGNISTGQYLFASSIQTSGSAFITGNVSASNITAAGNNNASSFTGTGIKIDGSTITSTLTVNGGAATIDTAGNYQTVNGIIRTQNGNFITTAGNYTTSTGNIIAPNGVAAVGAVATNLVDTIQLTTSSFITSTITAANSVTIGENLTVSTVNGYPIPSVFPVPSTIAVTTINQIGYYPLSTTTLNINGYINFSSLEGIQVQGPSLFFSPIYSLNGRSELQRLTVTSFAEASSMTVYGSLVAPNTVATNILATNINTTNLTIASQLNVNSFMSPSINQSTLRSQYITGSYTNISPNQDASILAPVYGFSPLTYSMINTASQDFGANFVINPGGTVAITLFLISNTQPMMTTLFLSSRPRPGTGPNQLSGAWWVISHYGNAGAMIHNVTSIIPAVNTSLTAYDLGNGYSQVSFTQGAGNDVAGVRASWTSQPLGPGPN